MVILSGRETDVNASHSWKRDLDIEVTLWGIIIDGNAVQPLKAYSPIVVTGKFITL